MNLDEELFLSAYLDGELAPDPRLRVESALAADPALADDLRALTHVRDLVAGLSRPSPGVDVSEAVTARIAARAATPAVLRILRDPPRPARSLVAAVLLAAASAVVVFQSNRRPNGDVPPPFPAVVMRPVPPATPAQRVPAPAPAVTPAPAPTALVALGPNAAERLRDAEQQSLRQLLDSPNLRKVFMLADVVGEGAGRKVKDLIGLSPRRLASYVCITVAPGVGPDAGTGRGGAEVFVVVMDEQELGLFRNSLQETFHEALTESDPKAEQVTQLGEVGDIRVFASPSVARIRVPEEARVARRDDPERHSAIGAGDGTRGNEALKVLEEISNTAASGPTSEQENVAPDRARGRRRANDVVDKDQGHDNPKARPYSVVLVWVPRPDPRTTGRP